MHVYARGRSLYVSLTNRCPTACVFCVKTAWGWRFGEDDLRVAREPSAAEVSAELDARLADAGAWDELVFCGYGECVYRLPEMSAIGLRVKRERPGVRLRLNTVGLGSLIWGRDIAPELSAYLDEASVSLNTADPAQWAELHRPQRRWRRQGFEAARGFARRCAEEGIRTRVTAVDLPGVDLGEVAELARELGASFLLRPRLESLAG